MLILSYIKIGPGRLLTISELFKIDISTVSRYIKKYLPIILSKITGVGHYINSQTLFDLNKTLKIVVLGRVHMNDPGLAYHSGLFDMTKHNKLSVIGDSAYKELVREYWYNVQKKHLNSRRERENATTEAIEPIVSSPLS
ncbi:hypothetical protein ACTFIW_003763 [Dictyostelium discoideum]